MRTCMFGRGACLEQQRGVQPGRECGVESVMHTCTEGGRGWRDGVGIPECVAMWALARRGRKWTLPKRKKADIWDR